MSDPVSTASTGASAPVEWDVQYNATQIWLSEEFLQNMIQTMLHTSYRRQLSPWEFSDPPPTWAWDPFPRWTVTVNAYNRLRAKPSQWRETLAWKIMPYGEYDRDW